MDDARPKMCFSLSPPPSIPKTIFPSNLTFGSEYSSNLTNTLNYKYYNKASLCNRKEDIMQQQEDTKTPIETQTEAETSSDYKQWLHAMKLVARLPGGIPPEFRRKLWLSLADKYLKSKNVDWVKEEEKCFCEKWREDDEELGIQIVKDLHRTGSTLCTGPAGDLNQAKLKRILLGYARYNPEVGYCQGFNMLGALILQVMDKNESESIKVMIYLVEGILPSGYFCGSMGGLQADMAVFRELMQSKLPRLAKHLQKLQGPIENAYEPPLTNVFTMQWFLTMFCTCLPMSCVLRVWDLVLIEGSDVLLRTALALWSLLEERVLNARSADDFYGKMGSFSSELLNGHLIDSNGLIEKVVQLGPITDIQKLRDKHLYNIAPIQDQQGLQLYYDDDEPDIDEDSRLAVATVWGIPWGRRGSQGQPNSIATAKQVVENKDRIALDISLLKKQYDRLRERQKQAHIILTTACSTASRPVVSSNTSNVPLAVNQLLSGRPAIITNKGRRNGPPIGAIPPARKPSLPAVLQDKSLEKPLRRGETLHWRDAKDTRLRRDSLSWKEIKAERAAMISSGSIEGLKSQKIRSVKLGKSDSSSYSEESDENEPGEEVDGSSTDTSLCDEEFQPVANGVKKQISIELDKESSGKSLFKQKKNTLKQRNQSLNSKDTFQKVRPKSWAPSNSEIPFVLMTTDSPNNSADENEELEYNKIIPNNDIIKEKTNVESCDLDWKTPIYLPIGGSDLENLEAKAFTDTLPISCEEKSITVEQSKNKNTEDKCLFIDSDRIGNETAAFDISNEGVTNEYFERVNSTERPTKLDLLYSLNEDENVRDGLKLDECIDEFVKTNEKMSCMDLLVDYSEKSSAACIEEAKTEISATFQSGLATQSIRTEYNAPKNEQILKKPKGSAEKRKDPRRLTLTRSSTMDIEKRYQTLEKRLSMEVCSKYMRRLTENELDLDNAKEPLERFIIKPYISNYKYDNDSNMRISENNICLEKKKIPSTADLEERFKNIQQQLVNDRKQMMNSPCDSENTGKPSNSKYSDNINSPTSHNEKNFGKTKKPKYFDDELTEDSKSELSNLSTIKDNSSTLVETEKAVLNRKNDIEQSSVHSESDATRSKSNTLQSKKEPPDDTDLEAKSNKSKDLTNSPSEISCEDKKDIDLDVSEVKSPNNSNKNSDNSVKTIKSNDNKQISDSNILNTPNENLNEENREYSINKSGRTSPPSTAELEKRFSALEEQLGSAKNVSHETEQQMQFDSKINQHEKIKEDSNSEETAICSNKKETLTTDLTKFKNITENSTKRRLSEPPSTEDLEKRYEVLKRRMSSRNFDTKNLHRERFTNETQSTNKVNIAENAANSDEMKGSKQTRHKISPPSTENLEERFEKLQSNSESKVAIRKESPPSTENLEKRYEKLQSKNDIQKQSITDDENNTKIITDKNTTLTEKSNSDNLENEFETLQNKRDQVDQMETTNNEVHTISAAENDENFVELKENVTNMSRETLKETSEVTSKKNAEHIKIRLIEELQAKIKEHSNDVDIETSVKKKNALIDELKAKLKPLPNEILKPTQISSNRPIQTNILLPSQSFNDETLESHATSAYRKSGNYEPNNITNRRMVRRFSDLPSRADLENRLQFLEEQLSKTVYMQRRSSDSEVASKSHYKPKTTFSNVPLNESLELRVQELEKRLNDNKTLSMDIACTNTIEKNRNDTDVEIAQIGLATDAVTGKELVRYSSYGEVGDIEHQNPINISINIQMTLNKDDIANKNNTTDLDRRLQYLEEQLKSSRVPQTSENNKTLGDKKNLKEEDTKSFTNVDKLDANETGSKNNVEENSEVDDSEITQKISQHAKENESDLKLEQIIPIRESTEVRQNDCVVEDDKLLETIAKSDNCTIEKDDLSQLKTIKDMENIKTADTKISNEASEKEKPLYKQPTMNKEQDIKAVDNKNLDIQDIKRVEKNETDDPINITNTHAENQNSLKDNKIDFNDPQPRTKSSQINDKEKIVKEECNLNAYENGSEKVDVTETNKNSDIEKTNILSNTCTQIVPVEVNKKTLVLLLDNEPKAVKVRRLTRANTEELEDLFQALEKQLNDRSHGKTEEKKTPQQDSKTTKEMLDLAKEIENFSKTDLDQMEHSDKVKEPKTKQNQQGEEEFDWGKDPIKYHLKKRTVYLPSTKELEARFRSLERQIKLLEDVEKIDVEQRLVEIERKIKLQYSLSHEKDLNKFLELCEGKDIDEMPTTSEKVQDHRGCCKEPQLEQKCATKHRSPSRSTEPIPSTGNLEYRYRSLDFERSKSKQNLKKQPIHPLEMLLDPSPDESQIPTTGELEHRIRVMEEQRFTPSPPSRKSHSQSPSTKIHPGISKQSGHMVESTESPTEKELPTAEELEARLEALEREQCFNFKMQKNFQQFNQKLKDVVSPSLSFDEFKSSTTKPQESDHTKVQTSATLNPLVSPKTIRFREIEKSQALSLHDREFTKSIADSQSAVRASKQTVNVQEGLGTMGIRLMRETSPLRRKGTHTGVPLRTGENINDQLTSIQNTIKSIDSLCEEKPYHKEKCQQYIDALFSDSTYFAHKKTSLEDLTSRNLSRSSSREIGPSIRISDHSPAFTRSMGSADSIRSSSPLRSLSPQQYRSNRDLRREPSPRRRREEDREEHESRVRRDNLLPNNLNYTHRTLSHTSHNSLTKFHKVDSQLIPNDVEHELDESLKHSSFNPIDNNLLYHDNISTSNNINRTPQRIPTSEVTTFDPFKNTQNLGRPISPFRQTMLPSTNTPVYTPAKLEIRHTTVTSTFYDRVLAEKQLEKQQHHYSVPTSNQSPIISPLIERNLKSLPYQQQTNKSPTNLLLNDSTNTLILTNASTGNYDRNYKGHLQQ